MLRNFTLSSKRAEIMNHATRRLRRAVRPRAMSERDARSGDETARTGVSQETRFQLELEFVMSLSNPRYVHHLAMGNFFDDPSFVAYLAYLTYWQSPSYAKFLHYPHALYFLDQLQRLEFRKAMQNPRAVEFVFTQQFLFWQKHRSDQVEMTNTKVEKGDDGETNEAGASV